MEQENRQLNLAEERFIKMCKFKPKSEFFKEYEKETSKLKEHLKDMQERWNIERQITIKLKAELKEKDKEIPLVI